MFRIPLEMENGLHLYSALYSAFIQSAVHLYSAFIQRAVQFMPLIHTHTFTHQQRLAAMQGTNQLVRSNWGLGVLLRDTSTRPGWDRTGNPPTARRLLLPPEPCRTEGALQCKRARRCQGLDMPSPGRGRGVCGTPRCPGSDPSVTQHSDAEVAIAAASRRATG